MSAIISRPYQHAAACCEACVFGKGEHAEFCAIRKQQKWLTGLAEGNFLKGIHTLAERQMRKHLDSYPE